MPHREPTVHRRELMVGCSHCGSVPGAACYGKNGRPMTGVHEERAELHRQQYPT